MSQLKVEPTAFFTFCLDDFATKLSIPKAFAKEHREFLLQKSVTLKTAEPRRYWNVKIRKNNKGDFQIAGGWSDFVNDNNILEIHFLVLRIVSASTLHVTIFRDDSCFYRPPLPAPTPTPTPTPTPRVKEDCWRFVKELKDYHFLTQRLEVPLRFAVSTGIAENKHATLKDSRGREWPVKITNRNIKMYSMTSGWVQFLKGNKLQPRTVLLFEFVPASDYVVVNVVVMANQAGKDLLLKARKGGALF